MTCWHQQEGTRVGEGVPKQPTTPTVENLSVDKARPCDRSFFSIQPRARGLNLKAAVARRQKIPPNEAAVGPS